jgi:hypothetical protein
MPWQCIYALCMCKLLSLCAIPMDFTWPAVQIWLLYNAYFVTAACYSCKMFITTSTDEFRWRYDMICFLWRCQFIQFPWSHEWKNLQSWWKSTNFNSERVQCSCRRVLCFTSTHPQTWNEWNSAAIFKTLHFLLNLSIGQLRWNVCPLQAFQV